ncbi:hypothetical protein DYE48_09730 [Halobacillus trueperi]|uniref:Uncharacterized protein n=1 Tax=Halobacillus trueperi TaxID=156205 RepID=A0A3E0J8X4_9BACI|nr:hypothetical protein DYE48_09730 [Halobacillus trueperi]
MNGDTTDFWISTNLGSSAICGSGFETLIWQRGGGEWRDSCGKKVLGETPQSGARGGSPRPRGKRVIPLRPQSRIQTSRNQVFHKRELK